MKYEPRYPFHALDNIIITDNGNKMYQITQEAIPFFDYLNYYISQGGTLEVTLNGQTVSAGPYNLHVPNLTTSSTLILNQAYLGIDSMDVAIQVKVNGTYLFYLSPTGTYLTASDSPITRDMEHFIWSTGSTIIPQLTLINRNPSVPVYAVGQNQGVQVWGYTYTLKLLSPAEAQDALRNRRYSTITITPSLNG